MSISDEAFREAFKPLNIPAHYADAHDDQSKVIYALAQIGEGSTHDVALKLHELDSTADVERWAIITESILNSLFDKGLVNGAENEQGMHYNLSKITEANDGAVNPGLLAPGLD